MSQQAGIANNTLFVFMRQIGAGLIHLVALVLIARYYGAEGSGIYAMGLLLPNLLVAFLNFGIAPANVYFIASSRTTPFQAFYSSLFFCLSISILGLIVGGFVIHHQAEELFPGIPKNVLLLALFSFPVNLMLSFASSIFQGLQKFKEFNIAAITQPIITLIGIIGLLVLEDRSYLKLVGAYFAGSVVTLVVVLSLLRKHIRASQGAKIMEYLPTALKYGLKSHLTNMLAFVNYRMDIYFVNFFLTPVASGLYAVAVKLGERMWLLSQAVSTVIFPRLSALKNSDAKKRDITPIASRIVLLFTGILCLLVASFANYIIPVLFGQEFAKAVLPLLILLPGIAVLASSRIVANDFAARGKPEWNLYISVPVTVINLVGNIILIPTYGLIGAAIATTIAYTIRFIAVTAVYSVVTRQSPLTLLVVTKSDIKLIASSLRKNYGS